jgi:DNA adenine methylase
MRSSEPAVTSATLATTSLRPFLKWAGGKRQLLTELRRFVPAAFRAYHEPFLGSGALFFDLWSRGGLSGRSAYLTDTNLDLIGCYTAIRDNVDGVIASLEGLERAHRQDPVTHYYRVRDERFNPARKNTRPYSAELAAMFIYLNRTGFNGLFRLNSRGAFNVPVGRYSKPTICNASNLRAAAAALSSNDITIQYAPYYAVIDRARAYDLVYFDPPYAPLSATARFTSYTAAGFSDADQARLSEIACELIERGCYVIISNSTAPLIRELYGQIPTLRRHQVEAKRVINSNSRKRGVVVEYIISNVPRSKIDSRPTPDEPAPSTTFRQAQGRCERGRGTAITKTRRATHESS